LIFAKNDDEYEFVKKNLDSAEKALTESRSVISNPIVISFLEGSLKMEHANWKKYMEEKDIMGFYQTPMSKYLEKDVKEFPGIDKFQELLPKEEKKEVAENTKLRDFSNFMKLNSNAFKFSNDDLASFVKKNKKNSELLSSSDISLAEFRKNLQEIPKKFNSLPKNYSFPSKKGIFAEFFKQSSALLESSFVY